MIEVKYVPEREAIRVGLDFHCEQQYLAEVIALFDALTRTMEDKELFIMAVQDKLNQLQKDIEEELKNDKNNTCNESDQ